MSVVVVKNVMGLTLAQMRGAVSSAIFEIGLEIEAEAKKRIQTGPKSGRVYRRSAIKRKYAVRGQRAVMLRAIGGRGKSLQGGKAAFVVGYRVHRASASGEAPATDLGGLVNSIRAVRRNPGLVEVVASAEYAGVLEERRNRPFMRPAAEEVGLRAEAIVQAAVDREVPG
jgi:hypothetical protein